MKITKLINFGKMAAWILFLLSTMLVNFPAQQERVHFETVDLYIDSGDQPLAAYQIKLKAKSKEIKLVGIEGGQAGAFETPPFYDPKALQKDQVILAAYTLDKAAQLPKGKTRVATLHLQLSENIRPEFETQLQAAGTKGGKRISATITLKPNE